MPYQQHSWTISCLLSAFLQLFITYLLLSCSALAFFFSKLLSFFRISLPCTCHPLHLDFPSHSLSSVHLSIASKFPFNLRLVHDTHFDDGVVVDDDGVLKLKGRPSYSSLSGGESSDKFDRKGKGSSSHMRRSRVRYRRRGGFDDDKLVSRSPFEVSKMGTQLYDRWTCNDGQERSLVRVTSVQDLGGVDGADEEEHMLENATSLDIHKRRLGDGVDCHDQNAVVILEQALELEQSARAALCAELEQERLAAATAADETMAMISRLQEEKASVEIEARQYQRILEEKSAYDAEEMTILKEIIMRRETEIHFLEKELEEYRKRFQEIEVEDTQEYYEIMDSHVDPSSSETFQADECRGANIDKGKESPESYSIGHDGDEAGQEIQEKGILSSDYMLFSQISNSKNSLEHEVFEENSNPGTGSMSNDNVMKGDQGIEPHVHDVHIVASKCKTCNSGASKFDSSSEVSNSHKVEDSSSYRGRVDPVINRSCSDMGERYSSLSTSPSRSLISEQRQNSLSSVDQERMRIDTEIGCLRARLRAVQTEREKLKSSLQNNDQGITELRLLEDIAVLLREIRRLREPENAARQASLPPLSSKETSKRRRSRSTSVGVGQSTST